MHKKALVESMSMQLYLEEKLENEEQDDPKEDPPTRPPDLAAMHAPGEILDSVRMAANMTGSSCNLSSVPPTCKLTTLQDRRRSKGGHMRLAPYRCF